MRTIYAAENRMDYILEYLKERSDNDSKLYKKSRDRFEKLAAQCVEALELISGILQEDALEEDELQECGPSSNYDNIQLMQLAQDMQATLDKMNAFTSLPSVKQQSPVEESKEVPDTSNETEVVAEPAEPTTSERLSPSDKKEVLKEYSKVIKSMVTSDTGNYYSNKCCLIIYDWLRLRFDKDISQGFHYDIRHIPIWISDLIYAYGYYVQIGDSKSFESDFYAWVDSLSLKKNNYALPFFVHNIVKDTKGEYLSVASLVLWDILVDVGLKTLSSSKVPFDETYLIDRSMKLADSIESNKLDGYSHYKYVPRVFECANMIVDESEENN